MDPSLDSILPQVALIFFYGGAALFMLGSMLPGPATYYVRALGAITGTGGALLALFALGKLVAFLGSGIGFLGMAALILFQYRHANRRVDAKSLSGKKGQPLWFLACKNGFFLILAILILLSINHELDRKMAITSDWAPRLTLMKGAAALFCSGLFGIFAEPLTQSWERWPFRINSVTLLLIGGWAIFAVRPTEFTEEAYDGLGFLVILFQAAIGINLLATLKSFQGQPGTGSPDSTPELGMNELKF